MLLLPIYLIQLLSVSATTAKIQRFTIHPTSQLLNSHKRNLSYLQQTPDHQRNSAVYATLEPFLSTLPPGDRESFQNRFEEARRYSRHETVYRENERRLRGRRTQLYNDPQPPDDEVLVRKEALDLLLSEGKINKKTYDNLMISWMQQHGLNPPDKGAGDIDWDSVLNIDNPNDSNPSDNDIEEAESNSKSEDVEEDGILARKQPLDVLLAVGKINKKTYDNLMISWMVANNLNPPDTGAGDIDWDPVLDIYSHGDSNLSEEDIQEKEFNLESEGIDEFGGGSTIEEGEEETTLDDVRKDITEKITSIVKPINENSEFNDEYKDEEYPKEDDEFTPEDKYGEDMDSGAYYEKPDYEKPDPTGEKTIDFDGEFMDENLSSEGEMNDNESEFNDEYDGEKYPKEDDEFMPEDKYSEEMDSGTYDEKPDYEKPDPTSEKTNDFDGEFMDGELSSEGEMNGDESEFNDESKDEEYPKEDDEFMPEDEYGEEMDSGTYDEKPDPTDEKTNDFDGEFMDGELSSEGEMNGDESEFNDESKDEEYPKEEEGEEFMPEDEYGEEMDSGKYDEKPDPTGEKTDKFDFGKVFDNHEPLDEDNPKPGKYDENDIPTGNYNSNSVDELFQTDPDLNEYLNDKENFPKEDEDLGTNPLSDNDVDDSYMDESKDTNFIDGESDESEDSLDKIASDYIDNDISDGYSSLESGTESEDISAPMSENGNIDENVSPVNEETNTEDKESEEIDPMYEYYIDDATSSEDRLPFLPEKESEDEWEKAVEEKYEELLKSALKDYGIELGMGDAFGDGKDYYFDENEKDNKSAVIPVDKYGNEDKPPLGIDEKDSEDEGDNKDEEESGEKNGKKFPPYNPITKNLTMEGGLLNLYQPVPLLQGYGTHYATVWVGSPPQRKSVIVDTGSHYTAFPCVGCQNCGEENHTDKYFDPGTSSTFHALRCDECIASRCESGRCTFSQSYTEGSSWQAYQVRDRFFVGKNQNFGRDDPLDNSFAIPFMFGCQTSETGLFVTQLADGIMGMSSHEATLPKQMFNMGKISHNMFTLCFRRELSVSKDGITAGIMTLGGIDTRLHNSPMVYTKNVVKNGWYTIYVRNIFMRKGGGQSAKADSDDMMIIRLPADINEINSGKGVIVDSGTTDTYLHKSLAASFNEAWKSATGVAYSNSAVRLTHEQLFKLPTVLVQVSAFDDDGAEGMGDPRDVIGLAGDLDPRRPNDVILAIPATHYMEYSPSKDVYTSRLYFTETRGGVIGANAMQGHDVLFDWENGRVGFAESSCDFEALGENIDDSPEKELDAGVVADCQLSPPSLAMSCAQSVDEPLMMCKGTPKKKLEGSEKWVWVVDNAGSRNGMSCEEVAMKRAQDEGIVTDEEVLTLECEDNGLCYMVKKCGVLCRDVLKNPPKVAKGGQVTCGDNRWGACTSICTQSKITSVLMDDGQCHEVDSEVQTRPCHTEECGRDDPCRVPFVVHAVFGLSGVRADLWNRDAEELFIEALSSVTAQMASSSKSEEPSTPKMVFGPGDVSVLMVSRWDPSENNPEQVTNEGGLKLIVEISIFNPEAKLPVDDDETSPNVQDNDSNNSTIPGISAMLDKIKFLKRDTSPPKTSCEEEDLYPYAKNALFVHTQLQTENFIPTLIKTIQTNNKNNDRSDPFKLLPSAPNVQLSKVLTSWTIKTEIGGEGSYHDHNNDESLLGRSIDWYTMKAVFTDSWLLIGMAVVLVILLLVGAKCGYNCGARSQMRRMGIHSDSLMERMRARTDNARKGQYRPVQSTEESAELELT